MKAMNTAKFNEAVEVHIRLGVNVRHADQQVRGTMVLPHGLGRDISVAVFAQGDKAREAEAAGADVVGATTSQSAFRAAGPISTWRSRRRT